MSRGARRDRGPSKTAAIGYRLTPIGHISTLGVEWLAGQTKPINLLALAFAAGFRVTRQERKYLRIGHEDIGSVTGEWGTWGGMSTIVRWAKQFIVRRGPWVLYLHEEEVDRFLASVEEAKRCQPSFVDCTYGDDVRGFLAHKKRYLTTICGVAIVCDYDPPNELLKRTVLPFELRPGEVVAGEIAARGDGATNWEAFHVSHDAEIRAALRANEGESTLAAAFRVAGRGPALPIFLSQLVEKALLAYLAETSESPHARHKVALQGNIARGRVELHSMRAESVYP